jgi:hypothetical protein
MVDLINKNVFSKAALRAGSIAVSCCFILSFILSIILLIRYFTSTDLPDENLFFLLAVLRYSSFLVCICSIYLLIICIISLIRNPSPAAVLGIIFFICSLLFGAGIIVINSFIVIFAGGSG